MPDEPSLYSIGSLFMIIFAVIIILLLLLSIVSFVLMGIGLYTMAKKRKLSDKAFWAWIPVGQDYLYGLLAKENGKLMGSSTYRYMHIILPVFDAIRIAIVFISTALILILQNAEISLLFNAFISILALAFSVVYIICFYGLIRGYDVKNNAGLHTFLALFIPLYQSIIIFLFRNRDLVWQMPTDSGDNTIIGNPSAENQ